MLNRSKYLTNILALIIISLLCMFLVLKNFALLAILGICALTLIKVFPMFFILILPLSSLFYLPILRAGTLNLTLTDLVLILIGISAVIYSLTNKSRNEFKKITVILTLSSVSILIFGFIGHLSTFGNLQDAVTTSLLFAKRFSMYSFILLALPFSNRRYLPLITYILLLCILLASLSAIFPQINDLLISSDEIQNYGDRRVGLLLNPNIAGNYGVVFLNFSISLLVYGKDLIRSRTPIALVCMVLSLALLFVSGSRGAILAALTSIIFWIWYNLKNKNLFYAITVLLVAGFSLVSIFPELSIIGRLKEFLSQGTNEINVASRATSQAVSLQIFLDYPFFGAGADSLPHLSPLYGASISGSDSQYIDTLEETGILGLTALLYTLYKLFTIGFLHKNLFGIALAVNVLSLMVSGFSAFTFYSPFLSILIWYFLYITLLDNNGDPYED